jgi:hypothetical protein
MEESRNAEVKRGEILYFFRLRTQSRTYSSHEPIPVVGLLAQTLTARGGQLVKLSLSIILRCAPVSLQQPLAHQPKQTGIERALFDEQRVSRDLSDAQKNTVTVQRSERDSSQDEEIESAGKKLCLVLHQPS